MTREFGQAVYRIRNCKPANSTRCYNMPRAVALAMEEQKSWRTWRDAHCNAFAFAVEDTSAESVVRDDCKTKLTVARTREIKRIGEDE